ncbi:MAG: hypothetical protein IT292_01185 [Deltaproteobacteria bacterium]|nr:hypothetical protein [Deltaproteobacteria bacterium]
MKLNKVREWKYQALTLNFKGTKWSDLRLKYDIPSISQQFILAVERTMDGFEAIDCSKDTSGVCANYKGKTVNDYCKYANGSKGAYGASLGTLFINKMSVGSGIKNFDCIISKAKPVAGSKNGKVGEYSPLGLGL